MLSFQDLDTSIRFSTGAAGDTTDIPIGEGLMKIKILGIGCPSCQRLEADVTEVVRRLQLNIEAEYVDDLEQILSYRPVALPGLVVDEKLVACGYAGKSKAELAIKGALQIND
jgi:small redox-active disulfide protein 2